MPNRLAHETSPCLLRHKDNPVDWYPWGPEALAKAKAEDKPIFLSIGYAVLSLVPGCLDRREVNFNHSAWVGEVNHR